MISYHTLALLLNITVVLIVAAGVYRRRGTTGAAALITLCLLTALWSASYLVYEGASASAFRSMAAVAAYLSAVLASSAVLWLVLVRTNRRRWISPRSTALAAVMPVLTLVMFAVASAGEAPFVGGIPGRLSTLFSAGPLQRIIGLYVFAMVLCGALLLLDGMLQRRRALLGSLGIAFVGTLLPLAALALEFAGASPFINLELLPFGFSLCAVGFLYGLFEKRPEEIGAIDRHAAVEGMDEGWIVLDVNDHVVDINPAAERMTGLKREEIYGQPVSSLLGDLSRLGLTLNTSQEVEMKRSFRLEEGWRYLNIRISTLMDRDRTAFGRLTLWRDMTERKITEDSRLRARDEMFVLINAISSAASNTLNTEDFLMESIYHIIYPFHSQVVGIFLIDEKVKRKEEARLQLVSHLGLPAEAVEDLTYVQAISPLFHWVMNNREPMQVEGAAHDERVPGALRRIPVEVMLLLPLTAQAEENGKVLGCMVLARKEKAAFSPDEIVRLTALSDHMASLIDSDRRRKLAIAMTERERLMKDLHDSVSQKLYGLVTTTEAAQAAMEAGSSVDPRTEFAKIGDSARQAVKEMRLFLYQMQQVDVEQDGLVSVLHHRLAAVEGRADIKARLLSEEEEIPLATDKQMTLYYIAMEALNNVLKHARAKTVTVTLKYGNKNVILEIVDDGLGFDMRKVDQGGLGLRNMRERAAQLNGKLQILTKPEQGTRIVVMIPRDTSGMKDSRSGRRE